MNAPVRTSIDRICLHIAIHTYSSNVHMVRILVICLHITIHTVAMCTYTVGILSHNFPVSFWPHYDNLNTALTIQELTKQLNNCSTNFYSSELQDSIDLLLGNHEVDRWEGVLSPSPLKSERSWRYRTVSRKQAWQECCLYFIYTPNFDCKLSFMCASWCFKYRIVNISLT